MENERRLNFRFYCKPPLLLLTGPESPLGGNKRDGKTLGWQEVGGGGGEGKEKRYGGKGAKRDISTETGVKITTKNLRQNLAIMMNRDKKKQWNKLCALCGKTTDFACNMGPLVS